jgi:hypothetical protein
MGLVTDLFQTKAYFYKDNKEGKKLKCILVAVYNMEGLGILSI